jgi:hypothetical protein
MNSISLTPGLARSFKALSVFCGKGDPLRPYFGRLYLLVSPRGVTGFTTNAHRAAVCGVNAAPASVAEIYTVTPAGLSRLKSYKKAEREPLTLSIAAGDLLLPVENFDKVQTLYSIIGGRYLAANDSRSAIFSAITVDPKYLAEITKAAAVLTSSARDGLALELQTVGETAGTLLFNARGGKASEDPAAFRGVLMGLREF